MDKHFIEIKRMSNGGSVGLPIIGETSSCLRRGSAFFNLKFKHHGEIFHTRLSAPTIPLNLETNKPLKNFVVRLLARSGFAFSRNVLIRRIGKSSLYSWQMNDILNDILESDNGYERKIINTIIRFLKLEGNLSSPSTQSSLCFEICSNIILNIEVKNFVLLDAIETYHRSKDTETRYYHENIIRGIIKSCIQDVYSNREKIYMGDDDDDTSFMRSSCFLECFLARSNKANIEDNITVLFQFLINEIYIPLVENMTILMDSFLHHRSSIDLLYKKKLKLKLAPSDSNELVSFSSLSTLSWINECKSSLKTHDLYQSREERKNNDNDNEKEGSTLITGKRGLKKENFVVDHVSQYKHAVKRLVDESRQRKVALSQRSVYYRADISKNDVPKDCIILTFPKDIMMNENFNSEKQNMFFDVTLCNLIHQMIAGYEFVSGSEYVDRSIIN